MNIFNMTKGYYIEINWIFSFNLTMWYNYMIEYQILLYNMQIKWHDCCKNYEYIEDFNRVI
jgi:hypothetical protein